MIIMLIYLYCIHIAFAQILCQTGDFIFRLIFLRGANYCISFAAFLCSILKALVQLFLKFLRSDFPILAPVTILFWPLYPNRFLVFLERKFLTVRLPPQLQRIISPNLKLILRHTLFHEPSVVSLVSLCVGFQYRIVVHFVRVSLSVSEIAAGLFSFSLYRTGAESWISRGFKEEISPAEPALAGEKMIVKPT